MKYILSVVLAALVVTGSPAFADMSLVSDQSNIAFQSIKKGEVIENHHFKRFEGNYAGNGALRIVIHLDSVDTGIPIRDERMKSELFETSKFAEAVLTANLDPRQFESGQPTKVETEATLSLHGMSKVLPVSVIVVKAGNQLVASSISPILLSAAGFGLDGGIDVLQKLANLPSITKTVPVSFNLVFQ